MPRRAKTELEKLLEQSIKLAREGKFPKRDSLGHKLRKLEEPDGPTSLDDPDDLPSAADRDAENW